MRAQAPSHPLAAASVLLATPTSDMPVTVEVPVEDRFGPPLEHRPRHRYDLWWWYHRAVPNWLAFLLPVGMALLPAVYVAFRYPGIALTFLAFEGILVGAMDVAIGWGILNHLSWRLILATTLWVEFFLLTWLIKNLSFVRRWERFDRFLRRREVKALELYQRRAWVRRFHFWGVVVFTFLPLNSGILMGVLVGKVTGMSDRRLFGAVYLGLALWAVFVLWVLTLSVEAFKRWVE